jgi:hypothetical protein
LAFCLMQNHFHLLVFQYKKDVITKLMRSLCTSYTMYFNNKYGRVGHLFQSRYKASIIDSDSYLQHISRYIHLNPKDYTDWQFSSLPYYLGYLHADWVNPKPIVDIFSSPSEYLEFISDYKEYSESLDELRSQLADK